MTPPVPCARRCGAVADDAQTAPAIAALDARIAAARAVADRLAALSPVAAEARSRYVRDGRLRDADAAFAMLLRAVNGLRAGEIADALGLPAENVATSLSRSPVVATSARGVWSIVEGPDLRGLDAMVARVAEDEAAGVADRARVDPFRRSRGRVPPLLWSDALRALFADGVERSTRRVHAAFDGGEIYGTRTALRARPHIVEPAGDDLWQRVPTVDELRAEVARLRVMLAERDDAAPDAARERGR